MTAKRIPARPPELRPLKWLYLFLLFMMGLTGFSQMPIFKRYYIADIPGLGWLAQFYVTHALHYIGAILLLAFMAYCCVLYFGMMRGRFALRPAAYPRILLLTAIVVTGVFRVLKNLLDVTFSPEFTIFIDISHLGFMMLLMAYGFAALILKRPWLEETNKNG